MSKVTSLVRESFGERFEQLGSFPVPLSLATPLELARLTGAGTTDILEFKAALAGLVKGRLAFVPSPPPAGRSSVSPASRVPTGHPGIDAVLDGGVAGGSLYHVFGPPASGKSETCYFLARAFLVGAPDATVHVIDADLRFQPGRLMEHGLAMDALRRVHVSKCHSLHHLGLLLDAVERTTSRHDVPSLLVLDSLVAPALRASVDDAISRQVVLARLFDKMQRLATGTRAVLFTNLSTADDLLPAGGDLPVARSTHLLRLARDERAPGRHSLVALKCPGVARACAFSIGKTGLLP